MTGLCASRTAIVTGAGAGLGRSHAKALAAAGAGLLVNDINLAAAEETAAEIVAAGGAALANNDDITDPAAAARLVRRTLEAFGDCQILVNNAGICRDRMFASMNPEDWDQVIAVHLKGHFCIANRLAKHWRAQAKEGLPVSGRIINTSSGAGLLGSLGQANYAAAKGGILSLTLVQAAELARYGVTANVLAPQARTGMTEPVFGERMKAPEDGFDVYHPDNVAPLVVWLASEQSAFVTGRCLEIFGGRLSLAEGWREGPLLDKQARWEPEELGEAMAQLLAEAAPPRPVYGA